MRNVEKLAPLRSGFDREELVDFLIEEAGCCRTAHAWNDRDVEQLCHCTLSRIHSTMSPDDRLTICTPHPGSASRFFSSEHAFPDGPLKSPLKSRVFGQPPH